MSAMPCPPLVVLTPRQFMRYVAEHARPFAVMAHQDGDREAARVLAAFADIGEAHVATGVLWMAREADPRG